MIRLELPRTGSPAVLISFFFLFLDTIDDGRIYWAVHVWSKLLFMASLESKDVWIRRLSLQNKTNPSGTKFRARHEHWNLPDASWTEHKHMDLDGTAISSSGRNSKWEWLTVTDLVRHLTSRRGRLGRSTKRRKNTYGPHCHNSSDLSSSNLLRKPMSSYNMISLTTNKSE